MCKGVLMLYSYIVFLVFFFFKQKTAYEVRISDWSSDVCSSDLDVRPYFCDGDECHMAYHFPLMPRIYMALAQEDRHPVTDIMRQTPEIPDNRAEERRVGKECVSTCRSRWSP